MVELQHEPQTGKQAVGAQMLLEVRNLKMWFLRRSGFLGRDVTTIKAVDDVSLRIRRGETLGLVGESGCGKTTVGRCVVRVYQPTAGEIIYHDAQSPDDAQAVDLAKLERKSLRRYRQEIRMIFQDPYSSLNPRMTIFEIVARCSRSTTWLRAANCKTG